MIIPHSESKIVNESVIAWNFIPSQGDNRKCEFVTKKRESLKFAARQGFHAQTAKDLFLHN